MSEVAVKENVAVEEDVNDRKFTEEKEIQTPEADHEDNDQSEGDDKEKTIDELPLPGYDEDEKKADLPKWAEKRLSKKDREIAQRDAENEALRAELQRNRPGSSNEQTFSHPDLVAPKREDFDNEDDYIDARIDYKSKKEHFRREEERQREGMLAAEMEFRGKLKDAWDAGSDKYDDFEHKAGVLFAKEFPTNRAMAEAIVDSEYKHDILYFLGTYSKEAVRIAKMNPIQAVKEIARLESRFSEKRKSTISKAPPPPVTLKSNQGKAVEGDPNKMGAEDFREWYNKKYGSR